MVESYYIGRISSNFTSALCSGRFVQMSDQHNGTSSLLCNHSQFSEHRTHFILFEPKVMSSGVSVKFFSDHSETSSGCTSAKLLFIAKPQPPCA